MAEEQVKTSVAADQTRKRVARPDRDAFKAQLRELDEQLAVRQKEVDGLKAKVDQAKGSGSGPNQDEWKTLVAEVDGLRTRAKELRAPHERIHEDIRAANAVIKKTVQELQTAKSKTKFKSVDEIDREIARLEKQVDSGELRLVEEKRVLTEASSLRKIRKSFAEFGKMEDTIAAARAQVVQLQASLDSSEYKAVNARITEINGRLDVLRGQQKTAYEGRNSLFEAKRQAENAKYEIMTKIRELRKDFDEKNKAWQQQGLAERKARDEREAAERAVERAAAKRSEAEEKLEAAREPAFASQLALAEGLLKLLDPSYKASDSSDAVPQASVSATSRTRRTVDTIPDGATVLSKKNQDEDALFVGKKGKKGRNASGAGAAATPAAPTKLTLNFGIIKDLTSLNVPVPSSKDDVANTVAKLQERITFYKENQDRVTKERIQRAEEELAKLSVEDEPKETDSEAKETPKAESESELKTETTETA